MRLSPQLTPSERLAHSQGASFFHKPWVSAPSTTTDRDGLGPLFNAHSCESCHRNLGRGHLPRSSTRDSSGLLFRLSDTKIFGAQLQTRAIQGFDAETQIAVGREETALVRTFSDGTKIALFAPKYLIEQYLPEKSVQLDLSPRLAPPLIGVGLIDAIADNAIRAQADPDDRDADGISGRYTEIQGRPGRYGWKAEQSSLRTQVAKAFHEDIGISSSVFPVDNAPPCPQQRCNFASGGEPEITDAGLDAVVDYLSVLTVPQPKRDENRSKNLKQGWAVFQQSGCIGCHRVNLQTAKHDNPLLSEQWIQPFSDFLLHDMGAALADAGNHALAREWRTAPLWGLGSVSGPYLHDGRAATLLDAILWHGGEAEAAVERVLRLNSTERAALLEFLAAL